VRWLRGFLSPTRGIGVHRRHGLVLLLEHQRDGQLPTSGRFLFYEGVQRGWISKAAPEIKPGKKMARRAGQDFSDGLRDLRKEGLVGWPALADETRVLEQPFTHATVLAHLLALLDDMHEGTRLVLDPWTGRRAPMVLCESRSLMGVLRQVLRDYRVRFGATNGQAGGFLHVNVAPALEAGDQVLYLGDLDLAGERHIEANTRRVLERQVGRLAWERLALTRDQVRDKHLSPIVKTDGRFKGTRGVHEAFECEALSQATIVQLVRERLDGLLPESLEDVLERQKAEATDLLEELGDKDDQT
jgi:hypothetical protein